LSIKRPGKDFKLLDKEFNVYKEIQDDVKFYYIFENGLTAIKAFDLNI